jgi:hypothetical protein
LAVIHKRIANFRNTVLGLADASGINDLLVAQLQVEWNVRMADEDNICLDGGGFGSPLGTEEWVGRSCMAQKVSTAVDCPQGRERQLPEICPLA